MKLAFGFCIPSNIRLTSLLEETKEAVAERYHIQASKEKNPQTISLKAKVRPEVLHAVAPNSDSRYPETLALMDHEEVVELFATALSSTFNSLWPSDDKAEAYPILKDII